VAELYQSDITSQSPDTYSSQLSQEQALRNFLLENCEANAGMPAEMSGPIIDDRNSQSSILDSIGTSQQRPQPYPHHTCPIAGWIVKDGKAIPVHCDRWDCSFCCREKGKKVWVKIKKSAASEYIRLMTLPFHIHPGRTWQEAIEDSGKILNRFFGYLRRKFPGFKYLWVREVGRKSNMVHFHVLVNRYLPAYVLRRVWLRHGGGYIVDIGKIRCSANYVCKYLAKLPFLPREVTTALAGKRRYSASRGILFVIPKSSLWSGATFRTISPWLSGPSPLLYVADGVYYFDGGP
jgi:hypothetical protein